MQATKVHYSKKQKKIIMLPEIKDFVIQPNRITNAIYDYSLVQERLFNAVMFYLQSSIQLQLNGEQFQQLSLWNNLKEKEGITLTIPLKEISTPSNYDYVKKAIVQLAGIVVEIPFYNEQKKANWKHVTGLLEARIPEINNYTSEIEIYIKKDVAKFLLEIEKNTNGDPIQYTRFIYQVAQSAKNKYTSRIYKKISSYKKKGGFTISIDEFRKWLGIENTHKSFSDIKEKILIPVQKELYEKADCWFNCKDKDFTTKKGQLVTHINFKVITPELIDEEEKKKDYAINLLRTHFGFKQEHINDILPIFINADVNRIINKISELKDYHTNNITKIANLQNYTIKALLSEFCAATLF